MCECMSIFYDSVYFESKHTPPVIKFVMMSKLKCNDDAELSDENMCVVSGSS